MERSTYLKVGLEKREDLYLPDKTACKDYEDEDEEAKASSHWLQCFKDVSARRFVDLTLNSSRCYWPALHHWTDVSGEPCETAEEADEMYGRVTDAIEGTREECVPPCRKETLSLSQRERSAPYNVIKKSLTPGKETSQNMMAF